MGVAAGLSSTWGAVSLDREVMQKCSRLFTMDISSSSNRFKECVCLTMDISSSSIFKECSRLTMDISSSKFKDCSRLTMDISSSRFQKSSAMDTNNSSSSGRRYKQ